MHLSETLPCGCDLRQEARDRPAVTSFTLVQLSCLKEDPGYKFLHILSAHPGTPVEEAAAAAVARADAEAVAEAGPGRGSGGGREGPMKSQSVQIERAHGEEPEGLRKSKSEMGKQGHGATGLLDAEMEGTYNLLSSLALLEPSSLPPFTGVVSVGILWLYPHP